MNREDLIEIAAIILVVVTIIALPFAVVLYDRFYVSSRFPKDAQIINLTASAKPCVWTRENIWGYNYWWKKFKRADEIPIYEGSPIIFRVRSSDLLHSFAIPLYRVGPYDVEAGKVKEIELKTNRLRSTKYLCWQYCSECHPDLQGRLVVMPRKEE